MKAWNNYFYGPVAAIRPYLFQKCFLLVVATDALVLMAERGSRYGIDGFNVAHFAWLDRVHPLPTATWYVGILMLVSLLAYTIVFLGPSRVLLAALAVLYTYSWAMSRHDSYLHHYLITLILSCMVFFPKITYADLLPVYQGKGVGSFFSRRPRKKTPDAVTPSGAWFVVLVLAAGLAYRTTDVLAASWFGFFGFFGLVGALAFVYIRQTGVSSRQGPLTSAWGFRLLGATVGVIYIYTATAKADAEWCGGYTLQQVGDATVILDPFVQLAGKVGIPAEWFWSIAATMVIPLELTIAASYFLAVRQDEPGRKWLPRWCIVAWLFATGLHLNNEMIDLSIQWFSYYMMFLAAFFFLPHRVLLALGACVVLPAHWWHSRVMARIDAISPSRQLAIGAAATALAAIILYASGQYIALPGALWALPVAGAIGVLYAAGQSLASLPWLRQDPIAIGVSLGLAGLVMAGVASQSSMRHDYYWNLGTEYQQNLTALFPDAQAQALAAYEIAEQYGAPDKQRELELMINMGLAHSRMNEFPAAHERYDRALQIDPESYHALFNKGVAYQVEGNWDQAAECFERATDIRPDYAIAYRELGRVQEQQGKLTKALVNLRTAGRLLPEDPTIPADIERLREARDTAKELQVNAKSE